ncbi:hypothetical protein [Psychrobacter vallis]|uniref:hypothetical protein n=1 Tax=Psychrobacter vallis TaxID=248451 RepID=UPI001919C0AF|nr:hypothetical protein [Psychrobacter vallis]
MLSINSKLIKVALVTSLYIPCTLNASVHEPISNPFTRELASINLATINYELLQANFMYFTINAFVNSCEKNAPDLSHEIAATGEEIFENNPKLTESLEITKELWREVSLSDDAGHLNAQQIDTLNMISGANMILRGDNSQIPAKECLGFLKNIQNVPNREQFWDNYLRQAIPVIIESS